MNVYGNECTMIGT